MNYHCKLVSLHGIEHGIIMSPTPSHPAVSLRRANKQDRPLLLTLIEEFCRVDQHVFEARRVSIALGPLLENDNLGIVYLVETERTGASGSTGVQETVCGYVIITWGYSIESGGREGLIDEIYLRRPGQGLGSALFPLLLDALAPFELKVMFLETERGNDRARRFYQHHGFVEDDSIWMSRGISAG
jgi:ribosomal protein S18 acetylase RimI-like enzyme